MALSWTTEYGQHLRSHHRRACHNTKANNDNTRVDNQYARADDCIRADGLQPGTWLRTCGENHLRSTSRGKRTLVARTGEDSGHSHCVQPYTWDELVDGYKDKYIPYKMGGLGKRLEPGGYQTWVCLLDDHPCGDPHYCWVYHETDKVFMLWGTNTELELVPGPKQCKMR